MTSAEIYRAAETWHRDGGYRVPSQIAIMRQLSEAMPGCAMGKKYVAGMRSRGLFGIRLRPKWY